MKRKEHTFWVEKYRPKTLEAYVSKPDVREYFEDCVEKQDIDNLLLWGVPGTGKTTAAKFLSKLIESDVLYINCGDKGNVETIKETVTSFASTVGLNNLKIIILDEAHCISFVGQNTLNLAMEHFSMSVRFILTSNFPDKILESIRSRCTELAFNAAPKPEIAMILSNILEKESVEFQLDDLKKLINTHYPDIRKTIRDAQRYTKKGVLKLPEVLSSTSSDYDHIVYLLVNKTSKTWTDIRQYIADKSIKNFEPVYTHIYENIDKFKVTEMPQVILSIAEAQFQATFVVDKEITFMAAMANILK